MKKLFILLTGIWMSAASAQVNDLYEPATEFPLIEFFYDPDTVRTFTSFKPLEAFRIDTSALEAYLRSLRLPVRARWADYLLNRDFVRIRGEDYSLRLYPVLYLEAGRAGNQKVWINTRGLRIDGELGQRLAFSTAVYENQARFPAYLDTLFVSRGPAGGFPATVPAMGIAKSRKNGVLDFPSARGHVTYRASKFLLFKAGHGTHFIGEGERSLLLDDKAPPYPYFRITARFWHVQYTVMWAELQDIRLREGDRGQYYRKKYAAFHYLDWAVTPRFNLGLFESVLWDPSHGRGMDVNFFNPVIFFKTVELQTGAKGGNTLLGLHASRKFLRRLTAYGQFLLDEMTVSKFFSEPGYWGNKFGLQLGVKGTFRYHDHLLFARLEWNRIRPYTYAHHPPVTNYGHDNYPLAHPWGANLTETLFRLKWYKGRWRAWTALTTGRQGIDFPDDSLSYGADIYRDYLERVPGNDIRILQGNRLHRLYADAGGGYLLNPRWNAEIYTGLTAVRHRVDRPAGIWDNRCLTWIYAGLRANMPFFRRDW
ncbi:MAG: hypothetical protein GXO27_06955 [Chlorobi bacterium]|nr:hypothetical protein [Chlorobiota bacterium]